MIDSRERVPIADIRTAVRRHQFCLRDAANLMPEHLVAEPKKWQ